MRIKFIQLIFVTMLILACSEQMSHSWDSGTSAKNSEIARKGWIPTDWLPEEAQFVKLQYDLDTNTRWLRFSLDDESASILLKSFEKLDSKTIRSLEIQSPRSCNWWFDGLIVQEPSNDAALYTRVLRKKDKSSGDVLLIVDEKNREYYLYIKGIF